MPAQTNVEYQILYETLTCRRDVKIALITFEVSAKADDLE